MKKTLRTLALLAIPAMFTASCGLSDIFTGDGGNIDGGSCSGGTVYQIQTGSYMTQMAQVLMDGCNLGLTATDFMTNRTVMNDAMGNITLYAADGSTSLGVGPVRCNQGQLVMSQPITLSDGPCTFLQTSTVNMTVTSANTFSVEITYSRAYMNTAGMTCTKPSNCTIRFSATMKK